MNWKISGSSMNFSKETRVYSRYKSYFNKKRPKTTRNHERIMDFLYIIYYNEIDSYFTAIFVEK